MTAIRNFPDSPLRHRAASPLRWKTPAWMPGVGLGPAGLVFAPPVRWKTPAWMLDAWKAMEDFGRRRAARELDLLATHRTFHDPEIARQIRRVAAECRNPSAVEAQSGGNGS